MNMYQAAKKELVSKARYLSWVFHRRFLIANHPTYRNCSVTLVSKSSPPQQKLKLNSYINGVILQLRDVKC